MSQVWDLNQNHTYACICVYEYICGLWRKIGMLTHACSESPDCKLQDAPMISAIGARGQSIWSTQSRLRAKSPHFDGLVHVLLTGLRISTANRMCPKNPFHIVFENTIKSKIGFILGSLHHFWSKRCDFCGVRHLVRSKFLMDWKALNNLHILYQFSGADQVAKLIHYTTEYPPCHGSQTLQNTVDDCIHV